MEPSNEPKLNGAFASVFIVAAVIIAMWGSIFLLFTSR
ncbi:cytochrome C oxidase subunit II [Exiguobacterium flavidum]|nr:cytochrome C oxidase subunit II [Exiguobacterium flavidum]